MEGNLNRARSSLSVDSNLDPSPPISRQTFRESQYGLLRNSLGHSRISSESNIAAAAASFRPATLSPRSSSALGVTGSYNRLLQSSRSADCIRDGPRSISPPKVVTPYGSGAFTKSKASLHDSKYNLEPLSEDGFVPIVEVTESKDLSHGLSSPASVAPSSMDGLRRSGSTTQVRDLKDQMNELKGRLSSLRDQARADSLKRRSVQSLRSPSPLSQHAHGFLPDSVSEEIRGRSMNDISRWNDGVESLHAGEEGMKHALADHGDNISVIASSVYSDNDDATSQEEEPQAAAYTPRINLAEDDQLEDEFEEEYDEDELDDMRTEDGYQDDEPTDMEDDMSVGGESLYHDSVQHQLSHEDREDAFDYEHFFLHSAMGSMSQRKPGDRRSWESFTSEDSVETTRGPTTNTEVRRRRGSIASISTTDSFATATEGRTTRIDNNDALDEDYPEMPDVPGTPSPRTDKRMTFGFYDANKSSDSNSDHSQPQVPNFSSARRPQSSSATFAHRPSVSSMGSSGTNRSFPLVNRPKPNGILTPEGSPDQGLKHISESLMSETASICESINSGAKPIEMLQREDQILVERLVASLGKCVLGLTENVRASTESRQLRRRIEMARRILDGVEQ
jgi:hypothetical protein